MRDRSLDFPVYPSLLCACDRDMTPLVIVVGFQID